MEKLQVSGWGRVKEFPTTVGPDFCVSSLYVLCFCDCFKHRKRWLATKVFRTYIAFQESLSNPGFLILQNFWSSLVLNASHSGGPHHGTKKFAQNLKKKKFAYIIRLFLKLNESSHLILVIFAHLCQELVSLFHYLSKLIPFRLFASHVFQLLQIFLIGWVVKTAFFFGYYCNVFEEKTWFWFCVFSHLNKWYTA